MAAVLQRLVERVRGARPGERNHTLNRAAWDLARLDPPEDAWDLLGAAAEVAGLEAGEIAATIRSARRGAAGAPLQVVETRYDRPPPRVPPPPPVRPAAPVRPAVAQSSPGFAPARDPVREAAEEREALVAEAQHAPRPGLVGPVGRTYGPGLPPIMADPLVIEAARLLDADLPGEAR